jgi:glycosyltransferase involved in cell wall biosynthesis
LYESVGMPVMEAMACGCPTLTANRYGTLELAHGASVLVEPESIDDIAAGIVRLLEDQSLRATLRRAGLERAKQFTWQRTAAEVMGVLESLPRLSPRRAAPCATEELGQHADSRP